jgi:hypothetical protein
VDPTPPGVVGVASLKVLASEDTLLVTDTLRLGLEIRDGQGNLISGRAVNWGTSAPDVATVAVNGVVTAVGPGKATLTATSGGKSDAITLTVVRVVFRVHVVPDAVCLRKGFTTALSLVAFDSLDRPLPAGLRPVSWRTTAGDVVAITPQGGDSAAVLGVAPGNALVSGTIMGVADTTGFIVDPAPLGEPLTCGQ